MTKENFKSLRPLKKIIQMKNRRLIESFLAAGKKNWYSFCLYVTVAIKKKKKIRMMLKDWNLDFLITHQLFIMHLE